MTSRGERLRPELLAGHTEVHRPHLVQASWSSFSFQEKSSMELAPVLASRSAGMPGSRLPAFSSRVTTFANEEIMWNGLAYGTEAMKTNAMAAWDHQEIG